MFRKVTQSQETMYKPSYLGKRGASGGGGPAGASSKRGGKASSVMSKAQGVKAVKQTPVSIIKKVVRSLAEKKSVNTDPIAYTFNGNNATMSAAVDLTAPLVAIAQGNTDGTRVGNRIRLTRYTLKIAFNFLGGASGVDQGVVQMFIGRMKNDPSGTPNATDLARIYQDGASTASADGTMLATLRDINTDYFQIVAYRKFKLGLATASNNNDFPLYQEFVIDNLLKGDVIYNDALTPANKFLFMWCQVTSLDDTNIITSSQVAARYYISCEYTDI